MYYFGAKLDIFIHLCKTFAIFFVFQAKISNFALTMKNTLYIIYAFLASICGYTTVAAQDDSLTVDSLDNRPIGTRDDSMATKSATKARRAYRA